MHDTPLELNIESKNVIGEINEDNQLAEHLEQNIASQLRVIEKQTDSRTTIDSITTSVPSSALNTRQRTQIEQGHLDDYRISRRL
jgi:hypothetical protein